MKLRLPVLVVSLSATLFLQPADLLAQSCTNTGRTGIVPVPEFGPNNVRLWGDLQPVDTTAIVGRRDSTQELFGGQFPNQNAPEFRDVTAVGDYIITTMPYGFDFWDAGTELDRRNPDYRGSVDGYSGDFATWQGVVGENNRVFERGAARIVGTDIVYVEVGKHGLAIWKLPTGTTNPLSNRTLLYQEWDGTNFRKYRDVELAEINGTLYAYVTSATHAIPAPGVHIFDVTSALGLTNCVDNIRNGENSCNVYRGSFTQGGQSLELGIAGTTLVYNSNFGRVYLYDLSSNPLNPTFRGELTTGSLTADVFRNRLGQVGVATREGSTFRVWDVTTCANTGSCSTVGTPVFTRTVGSFLDERSIALESNDGGVERDFVYLLERSGCPGRALRENLYDVSDFSAIRDIMPQTTDTFNEDGETSTVSYSGYYNMGSLATGFRQILPWAGTISGKYFYRVQRAMFDVHELVEQTPVLSLSGAQSSFIGDTDRYQVSVVNCEAASSSFNWTIPSQAGSVTQVSPQIRDITWSQAGDWQISVSATGDCGPALPASLTVGVADPSPQINSLTVNGQLLPPTPPYEALVCDQLTFAADVDGQNLAYDWEVRDGQGSLVQSSTSQGLIWDTEDAVAPSSYTLTLDLTNTSTTQVDSASRSISLDPAPPVSLGGTACSGASGPCLTQNSPGSSGMTLFANSVNAAEWRWQVRELGTTTWQTLFDFGTGEAVQSASLGVGTWEVRVTARRCTDEVTSDGTLQVTVDALPVEALFDPVCPILGICDFVGPATVNFTDSSSGEITSYQYDFTNQSSSPSGCNFGTPQSSPQTSFTYTNPGTYRPCLRVSNVSESDVFVFTDGIDILPGNPPSITVACPSSTTVGTTVACSASAQNCSPSASGWNWSTNGGSISGSSNGSSISVSWATTGTKTVSATNAACTGASGSDSVSVTDGGGGGPGGGLLRADFTFSPPVPDVGNPINLNGGTSSGTIVSYQWTITPPEGDAISRSGVQTSFTPDAPGPWRVSLVVLSQPNCANPACADEASETITVFGEAQPVTAAFTVSPNAPVVGQLVTVDTTPSTGPVVERFVTITAPSGTPSNYNGQASPSHLFEEEGDHTVEVRVTNESGCSEPACESSASTTVTVGAAVAPTAGFNVLPNEPVVNQQVTLDSSPSSGPIVNRDWTIRTPSGSTLELSGAVVDFVPSQTGMYRVSLLVETANGCASAACEAVASRQIEVLAFAPLVARIAVSPDPPRMNEPVVFSASASSGNPTSFEWVINGLALQGETVSFFTTSMGDLDVALTVRRGSESDTAQQTVAVFGPCADGEDVLCVGEGRFRVSVSWEDSQDNRGTGTVRDERTPNSGLFWFFNPDNIEQLIKVLDGCAFNGNYWVLAASLTDVAYELTVEDLIGDASYQFSNSLGTASPAIVDTSALPTCDAAAAVPEPFDLRVLSGLERDAAIQGLHVLGADPARVDDGLEVISAAAGFCTPGETQACMIDSRFRAEISFSTLDGQSGLARVSAIESDNTGVFYFFDPNNLELVAKVIDGCGINDRFWVFSAATTDQQYTLRVTDTLTGQVREYGNELGQTAAAVNDTDAFDSCSVN